MVATPMVALEVFFLKLKLFILTGIAGGIFTLKLQSKRADSLGYPHSLSYLNYLLTASLRDLPALNTGALEAGIEITVSGF